MRDQHAERGIGEQHPGDAAGALRDHVGRRIDGLPADFDGDAGRRVAGWVAGGRLAIGLAASQRRLPQPDDGRRDLGPGPVEDDGVAVDRRDEAIPGAKLDEEPFTAVLHGREPLRIERDRRALHVAFVLPVNVGSHSLESREASQGQDLAQAVELDDGGNAVGFRIDGQIRQRRAHIAADERFSENPDAVLDFADRRDGFRFLSIPGAADDL